jgi:copper resistance protein C
MLTTMLMRARSERLRTPVLAVRLRARVLAVIAAAFFAGALALAPATGVSAHDYLVDSSPAADSVQSTALKDVSLTFDDLVLDLSGNGSSSLLQVTGPDGATTHFETGCTSVSGRIVTAPVALGASGTYTVTWQIVSADGHTVSGSYTFDYRPPAGTKEAEGAANRPACGAADPGADTDSGAATNAPSTRAPGTAGTTNSNAPSSASADSASLGIVITIAAIIIGLAVIGVLIILVTSRRRPRHPDSDADASEDSDQSTHDD